MIFSFLKYIQPTNYFALPSKNSYVFPIYESLPQKIKDQLKHDDNAMSPTAKMYDLSWQAVQLGYIGDAKTYSEFKVLSVLDNYIFIRKYFNAIWALYILCIRILSFKNPVKEISAYAKSRNIKRVNYFKHPLKYEKWNACQSSLIAEVPFVSVIIPTLNRYKYLKDVLNDLEQQDYSNFEVIVIDQSEPFNKRFYEQFDLDIVVKNQKEKALWLARNNAIKLSNAELILLFDDDSRVTSNWISNHLKCIDFFKCDISSGVSISLVGARVPDNYAFFRRSDQLDTGNVLLKKEVFRKIGLFDRQFEKQRMGDGEFGLRAHVNGYLNISNPFGQRLHLKIGSGGLREMGSWDGFRPKQWFGPRPIPSVLYYFRRYYGVKRSILSLLKTVPPSLVPYRFKGCKVALILGFILSILIWPIISFQVLKSWYLASQKIKRGPLIEILD